MGRQFTLGYLIEMAKKRSDMEHQDLVSKEEWFAYASEIYADLHEAVAMGRPRRYEVEYTITTDGSSDYDLPDDFMTAIGVDHKPDSDIRRKLVLIQPQERNRYEAIAGSSEARGFAFVNDKLRLYPTPPTGQTYILVYATDAIRLEGQGSGYKIDVVAPNGEKFMIWGMAELALVKEESFDAAGYARSKLEEARESMREWAAEEIITEANRRVVNEGEYDYDDDPAYYRRGGW